MPREELNIERFDVGLVTAVDPKDVSLDAATDGSVNLEAMTAGGRLKGRLKDGASVCYAMTGSKMSGLIYSATAYGALVTCNGSTVYTTRWFAGGFTTSELVPQGSVSNPGNMTVFNREVRVGATVPKLCGYSEVGGSEALIFADCECVKAPKATSPCEMPIRLVVDYPTVYGTMVPGTVYFYKVSVEYDNYEESPLNDKETYTGWYATVVHTAMLVYLVIPNSFWVSPSRMTAINLYRAEAPAALAPQGPQSEFRFVKRITREDTWWNTVDYSGYHHYQYADWGDSGQTYDLRTGVSETMDSNFVNYKLSAVVNSQFVIAQCQHSEITDAGLMIFKSKANRPDMFNWIDDYIKMPSVPVCMVGFNGRLFVFDTASMYVLNTDEMFIEDAMPGVGVTSPYSALATHHGLFILDKNMPWVHDGTQLIPLGGAIIDKWRNQTWDQYSMVAWHERSGAVLFMDLSHGVAFAYNIASKRWDYWTLPASCQSAITDPSSNVMLVT